MNATADPLVGAKLSLLINYGVIALDPPYSQVEMKTTSFCDYSRVGRQCWLILTGIIYICVES